jgi:hypothetical protein
VKNGVFTPLVFGTNGEMGDECKKFHKELARKLSNKRSENDSSTINWIRIRLNYSIIRSTRVHFYAPVTQQFEFTGADYINYD